MTEERARPVPPWVAADAVIAIREDVERRGTSTALFGLPDGTLTMMDLLSYREVRQLIGEQWNRMTQEVIEGFRLGVRKHRGRWVRSELCDDGVVRLFVATDKRRKEPLRVSLPTQSRFAVFQRDGFRCRYCGNGPSDVRLQVDHVHPVSAGGTDDLDNLVTACDDCNMGKLAKVGVEVP